MSLSRREFLHMLAVAGAAGFELPALAQSETGAPYDLPPFGNLSLIHFSDCHAQLLPVYFREPSINIGVGSAKGKAPHLVGDKLLAHFGISPNTLEAHAFTYLDFADAAQRFGKVGGFAHLAALIKQVRAQRPHSLLLDSGDTWQGSATSLWTQAQDMVDATKLLGVDIMTGHWEFMYGKERVLDIIENELAGHTEFVAQNVFDISFGEEPVFPPYTVRELDGVPVAIIGQAFPYTPIANPRYLVEDWSFGIRDERLQELVDEVRDQGAQVVAVLSHNGMDTDLKMASRVSGVDVILGGHTHDAMPEPSIVANPGGKTLVVNSGSNGKFLSVLDLEVKSGAVTDYRFKMLPVFSNLIEPDGEMASFIENVRAPFREQLDEVLATTESTLYRRGNFNGTFDQLICDALIAMQNADIAFSPGFRWGTTVLPGDTITMERLMDQTAITYATATLNEMTGEQIKTILEDIADNLFNPDPYYQMGGDMVRVGGLRYTIDPQQSIGSRISAMEFNGKPLDPAKVYRVAGWASVNPQPPGKPVWDVVADYLRDVKVVRNIEPNVPVVKGIADNPGFSTG